MKLKILLNKSKVIVKSCTVWFSILAGVQIWMHQIGRDSKSIVLISLNPILSAFSSNDCLREFMNGGPKIPSNTIIGEISIYWYIASFLSLFITGLVIDVIRLIFRKNKE
jgi:hypothetical protein